MWRIVGLPQPLGPCGRSLLALPWCNVGGHPQWNRGLPEAPRRAERPGPQEVGEPGNRWPSYHRGPGAPSGGSGGFVLEARERAVYFAGDTFCRPFMGEIAQRFHPELALLPVTTYSVPMTMGERQAVKAVSLLKPRVVVPIHLGIRPRSPLMRNGQTPEGFARLLGESGSSTQVALLAEGDSREF